MQQLAVVAVLVGLLVFEPAEPDGEPFVLGQHQQSPAVGGTQQDSQFPERVRGALAHRPAALFLPAQHPESGLADRLGHAGDHASQAVAGNGEGAVGVAVGSNLARSIPAPLALLRSRHQRCAAVEYAGDAAGESPGRPAVVAHEGVGFILQIPALAPLSLVGPAGVHRDEAVGGVEAVHDAVSSTAGFRAACSSRCHLFNGSPFLAHLCQ